MKKKILILMFGFLLIGVYVYAAGDLIVNGKLGAGTSTLDGKINAESTDEAALNIIGSKTTDAAWFNGAVVSAQGNASTNASIVGLSMSATSNTTGATAGSVVGITGIARLFGSGSISGATGFVNSLRLDTTAGNYSMDSVFGQDLNLVTGASNVGTHTITNYYGIASRGVYNGSGTVGGTDWRHMYFANFPDYGGTVANVAGLWIDKQTYGTNNYGIVLNGYGTTGDFGSAVVFGDPATSQSVRLYAKNDGKLYVNDGAFETQHSPHDPVTGEWIFYSKNIETGKTVRVNMEKLVKAVEKLTGETFMVETLIEDK